MKFFAILLIFVGSVMLAPNAFGSESFYGTSSFENAPSKLTPEKPTQFEIKFRYTSDPYALSNFSPVIDVSPTSASSMVHIDVESLEGITQGQIVRIPVIITVNPNIEHEKIFLSIYFTGDHFSSRSDAFYKSAWTDSITFDIAQNDTIPNESPVPEPDDNLHLEKEPFCGEGTTYTEGICVVDETKSSTEDSSDKWGKYTSTVFESPLKQIKSGITIDKIRCNEGLKLIYKHDNTPTCIKSESIPKLAERGWISETDDHSLLALKKVSDSCANDSPKERMANNLKYSNGTHVFSNLGCEWKGIGVYLGDYENEN